MAYFIPLFSKYLCFFYIIKTIKDLISTKGVGEVNGRRGGNVLEYVFVYYKKMIVKFFKKV